MKHKTKSATIFFITMLFASIIHAQQKRNITLNEAIDLSLKNSKQLKKNQAKIEEATATLTEAIQRRLPDASFGASYLRFNPAKVDLKSSGSNNNPNATPAQPPRITQASYGILNFTLPVFAGGKISYGIKSSRYLADAVKLDADNDREEVIQNTIESFVNLYKAKASVNLVKENLNSANLRVTDLTSWEKNGLLARNDLLKAQLQQSNIELSLLDAENNWQLANINMNLLLGLPESTELILDSQIVNLPLTVKALDEYLQLAFSNRKDAAALELRKKAAETGVKATKGDYFPSVALSGGYIAASIPKFISVYNAIDAGIGISYNLGSLWKTKAKVQQAEAQTKQLTITQSMLADNIRLQVNQAYMTWLSSQKKIQVYEKAVEQAQENYRIIKNKFNNNLATTTDLLDADVADLQSRMNFVFAKADAVVAYSKLLQAAGIEQQPIK